MQNHLSLFGANKSLTRATRNTCIIRIGIDPTVKDERILGARGRKYKKEYTSVSVTQINPLLGLNESVARADLNTGIMRIGHHGCNEPHCQG